jgi:histidinol-phosphate aminotransferase
MPKHVIVFIDEAYFHSHPGSKGRDRITLIKQGHNVIITRTFSKAYGLAGIRLGYTVANPSLIKELRVFGFGDMGVNQAAYAAGLASLEDEKHTQKYKDLVKEGKELYYKQFDSLGLSYIRSITPFLMVKLNTSSKMAQKKLADKRVYVRKGEDWYMSGYLRITIGFQEENEACAAEIKRVLKL